MIELPYTDISYSIMESGGDAVGDPVGDAVGGAVGGDPVGDAVGGDAVGDAGGGDAGGGDAVGDADGGDDILKVFEDNAAALDNSSLQDTTDELSSVRITFPGKKRPFTINQKVKQQIQILEDEIKTRRLERNKTGCFYKTRQTVVTIFFIVFFFNAIFITDIVLFYTYRHDVCILLNITHPICTNHDESDGFKGNTVTVINHTNSSFSTTRTSGGDGRDGADGQDGRDGQDGEAGADGRHGQDGGDGEAGQDGQDGRDGRSCNCSLNVTRITEIVERILSETSLYFKEITTDKITANSITALTKGNFTNLYSEHYVGSTFNQCVQGSC